MPTITGLPAATSVTPDDNVLLVNAPDSGSPTTQRGRISDILSLATALLSGVSWQGTWSSGTTYDESDVVSYNGDVYISLVSTNLNQNPATEDDKWQKWVAQGPPGAEGEQGDPGSIGAAGLPSQWDASVWNDATTYPKGTAVRHPEDGASYVAVVNSATTDPSTDHGSGGAWRKISDRGFQGVKPFETVTEWATATDYTAGDATTPADAVFHTDSSYICLEDHTSGTFSTDLAADKWQMIAAPGGIASIDVVSPLEKDDSNPVIPELSLSTDEAGGVPTLDASADVRKAQLPQQIIRFTHTSQPGGSDGNIGGVSGATGGTSDSNASYNTRVEIARVTVPGDPGSTGDNAYQRRDELEATLTFNIDMSASEHCAIYLAWVKNTGTVRINPTVLTPHAIADGVSTNGLVTAHIRVMAPTIDAEDNEVYILTAWVKNNGGFIHDTTASGDGYLDVVQAVSHPI